MHEFVYGWDPDGPPRWELIGAGPMGGGDAGGWPTGPAPDWGGEACRGQGWLGEGLKEV